MTLGSGGRHTARKGSCGLAVALPPRAWGLPPKKEPGWLLEHGEGTLEALSPPGAWLSICIPSDSSTEATAATGPTFGQHVQNSSDSECEILDQQQQHHLGTSQKCSLHPWQWSQFTQVCQNSRVFCIPSSDPEVRSVGESRQELRTMP